MNQQRINEWMHGSIDCVPLRVAEYMSPSKSGSLLQEVTRDSFHTFQRSVKGRSGYLSLFWVVHAPDPEDGIGGSQGQNVPNTYLSSWLGLLSRVLGLWSKVVIGYCRTLCMIRSEKNSLWVCTSIAEAHWWLTYSANSRLKSPGSTHWPPWERQRWCVRVTTGFFPFSRFKTRGQMLVFYNDLFKSLQRPTVCWFS